MLVIDEALLNRIAPIGGRFEEAKLEIYGSREDADWFEIHHFDGAAALVAPDVGYLNRVLRLTPDHADHLPAILALYAATGTAFEIDLAPQHHQAPFLKTLLGHGIQPGDLGGTFVREIEPELILTVPSPVRTRPVTDEESLDAALEVLLAAREVPADWWDRAKQNMRRRAEIPGTTFFLGEVDDQPAAMAILYRRDGIGYMAEANTAPQFRRRGGQQALTAARLKYAQAAGCDLAIGCAGLLSTSGRNLQRLGFQLAYSVPSWRYEPDS